LSRLRFAFRRCLSRDPDLAEASTLEQLLSDALTEYTSSRDKAVQMATNPLGPAPAGVDVAELAAWTVVSNVVLNMDEFLMRR
jgi:hypothetical protein